MAWHSKSSSWDWDADRATVTSHGNGIELCKPVAIDWQSDTELYSIKHDGSFSLTSGGISSSEERAATAGQCVHVNVARDGELLSNRVVTPAMANMHAYLGFDGAASLKNMDPIGQGRVPFVTTCIGAGAFIGSIDHGNGSLESLVQKGMPENQGNGEPHSQGSKASSQHSSFAADKQQLSFVEHKHQVSNAQDKQHLIFAQDKHQLSVTHDKTLTVKSAGKDHSIAAKHVSNNSVESLCKGHKKRVADEQHSSTAMGSAGSGDSLTGLQLGKRTYGLDATTPAVCKAISKLNSTGKKARAGAAAIQIPRCQVEGCKQELTSAKDYHRRHKVCEPHSKARKVVVASLEQRFCQQCSRFHMLAEFDESKRSCRRRLAGHNKRRRKPQQDPLELQARLRSGLGDWTFLHQSRYPRWPLLNTEDFRSNGLWPRNFLQFEDQPAYDHELQPLGTDPYIKGLSSSVTHDKFLLSLLQSPKPMMPLDPSDLRVHQYLPGLVGGPMGNGLSLASSSLGAGAFTGFETTPITNVTRVSNSGRALSLLSLHPQCSQAPDMVSRDLSGLANTKTIDHDHHQHMQNDAVASQQFLLQGRHPYCHEYATTLSMASNIHLPSTTDVHNGAHTMASEKEFYECSYLDNLSTTQNGYGESHSMVANMQVHETAEQAKQTQDLMQIAAFHVPTEVSRNRPSMVFQLESSPLGGSHFPHVSSYSKF